MSASLAQIGEFSFILAGLGVFLGVLPAEGQNLILAGAIISIALNPLVFQAVEPAQTWIRARSKLAQALERPDDPLAALPMTVDLNRLAGQVVLVGYGRVGRRIGEALIAQGIPFVVAEENREIVEKLRASDIPAVSGDASDPAVLIQAHIHRARLLVIAIPDMLNVRRMIETARTVNPESRSSCARTAKKRPRCWKRKTPAGFFRRARARPQHDPTRLGALHNSDRATSLIARELVPSRSLFSSDQLTHERCIPETDRSKSPNTHHYPLIVTFSTSPFTRYGIAVY